MLLCSDNLRSNKSQFANALYHLIPAMSTRSGRIRPSTVEASPPRTRKRVTPPRSPGRARKTSPPTRPALRKSPSRKSPIRKPVSKFPARKSPSRTTKEATETAAQKSPGKRPAIKTENISVSLQDITKLDIYRATRSRRSEYSIKDLSIGLSQNNDEQEIVNGVDSSESNDVYGLRKRKPIDEVVQRRYTTRLREYVDNIPEIRPSPSKSASKSVSKSISQSITYSDEEHSEDELQYNKSESVTRKLATPLRDSVSKLAQLSSRWEFGGRVGSALLMLLIPLTAFSILLSCQKTCSLKHLYDLNALKSLSIWFSWQALSIVSIQLVIQALFTYVRVLGTKADRLDETGTKQYFNAFFCSIVTMNVLFALNFFNLYDSNKLLSEYLRLATVSYIFAVILSIILYVKSRKMDDSELNPYGNTGYALYDFCMGREIQPFFKKFDVKIWISRIANINSVSIIIIIILVWCFRAQAAPHHCN